MSARFLANRVAIVTGSSSGIGASIAQSLGKHGAKVVIHGLFKNAAEELAKKKEFESLGIEVAVCGHNLAHASEAKALVDFSRRQFGRVDILVNNAGIQHVSPVESFPAAKWDEIMAINLSSCFHLIQATLPAMRVGKYGRIINIASVHGHVASIHKSAYVAAKHGVVGLTKAIALETAGSGVTCNAICPGWVLTPLVKAQIDKRVRESGRSEEEEKHALLSEKQPSREFVQPSDLGELASFLCSPAGAQMTGVSLPMDGGWLAQ